MGGAFSRVIRSSKNGKPNDPPSYEISEREDQHPAESAALNQKYLVRARRMIRGYAIANSILVVLTICFLTLWLFNRHELSACRSASHTTARGKAASPSTKPATNIFSNSPVLQYTFWDSGKSSHSGWPIVWESARLKSKNVEKKKNIAIWHLHPAEAENMWYVCTIDLIGKRQWLSDEGASLSTTDEIKKRKAVRIDIGTQTNKKVKSTLRWNNKCLTLEYGNAHTMEAKTNCDEFELRPIKRK